MKKFIHFLMTGLPFNGALQAQQKTDPEKLGEAIVTMYVLDSTFQRIKNPCSKVDADFSQKFDAACAKWTQRAFLNLPFFSKQQCF